MIPESLNILNCSEEHLKERKTKKRYSKEETTKLPRKGRKAQ
jgi:hypothetical protein